MPDHQDLILDQFTRQAIPFSTSAGVKDEAALRLVVDFAGAGPDDTTLDVACGGGLIVCAFARHVRHATGIDVTPAMLEQARKLQASQGVTNVTWQLGDVRRLPYRDGSFTIVTSRFAFHHFLDPLAVLHEMKRVCAPGGRVAVIDSAPAPDKAGAFNRMEVVRDPSHVRAMPLEELRGLYRAAGLGEPRVTGYRLEGELEALIARSFPKPGDDEALRRIFRDSIPNDDLGIGARWVDGAIHYGYPVAVLVADR
ncbi:MAG: methyltransferase domain-containing protein [Candidatus Rokubacteria bacterium]|nr:methyltransferase domain-containing protein [Candidatus Rokubacteria bacterium]